jgi:single-strand DNA-binding protein
MAGSVNKVILIGNLGRDPEAKQTQGGGKIVNMTIATSETWNDKASGERKERTEWHRVVIFNERLAEVAEKYLKKGAKIYVEGALQTRKWTDQNGTERHSTEVVLTQFGGVLTMLDTRSGTGEAAQQQQAARRESARSSSASKGPDWHSHPTDPNGFDDEIPF